MKFSTVHDMRGDLFLDGYLTEKEADKIVDILRMYEHCEFVYNQDHLHFGVIERMSFAEALREVMDYMNDHYVAMKDRDDEFSREAAKQCFDAMFAADEELCQHLKVA